MFDASFIRDPPSPPLFGLSGARRASEDTTLRVVPAAAPKPQPPAEPLFQRRVGWVEGTFSIFVDLVSATPRQLTVARLFGPSERAERTVAETTSALSAYARIGSGGATLVAVLT